MANKIINPADMYNSIQFGFSHAVQSNSATIVHLAGQVAWDSNGELVGAGDLAVQCEQVFQNLTRVLQEANMSAANVVRLRTYVVDYSPDKLEIIGPAIGAFYGSNMPAANTLLGVQCLAMPDFLIEIEATAAVSDH